MYSRQTKDTVNHCVLINKLLELPVSLIFSQHAGDRGWSSRWHNAHRCHHQLPYLSVSMCGRSSISTVSIATYIQVSRKCYTYYSEAWSVIISGRVMVCAIKCR